MPESTRFPRVQDGGSSCRLVTGAKASAGQRDGPAGKKLGMPISNGPWRQRRGCCDATRPKARSVWPVWRTHTGRARRGRSGPPSGRAPSPTCGRAPRCWSWTSSAPGTGAERVSLPPHWPRRGSACTIVLGHARQRCVMERAKGQRRYALRSRDCLDPCAGALPYGDGETRFPRAAPLPTLRLTGAHPLCSHSCA